MSAGNNVNNKIMKNIIVAFLLTTLTSMAINAQDKAEAKMEQLLASRNFIFQAQSVNPQTGGFHQLTTSDYDVIITKDTVISWLPYFGRAYSAPINPSEGGIKFTSTRFDYTEAKKDKKGWSITIKPKDISDVNTLFLTVFINGTASLQVSNTNRQSISYRGYITENKSNNKKAF